MPKINLSFKKQPTYKVIGLFCGPFDEKICNAKKSAEVYSKCKSELKKAIGANSSWKDVLICTCGKENTEYAKSLGYETWEMFKEPIYHPEYTSAWWLKFYATQQLLKNYDQVLFTDFDVFFLGENNFHTLITHISQINKGFLNNELFFPVYTYVSKYNAFPQVHEFLSKKIFKLHESTTPREVNKRLIALAALMYFRKGNLIDEIMESYKESYKILNGQRLREEQQIMFYLYKNFGVMNSKVLFDNCDIEVLKTRKAPFKPLNPLAKHR